MQKEKEKIFNPASTNESSPATGMASVNSFNPEETGQNETQEGIPKNFEGTEKRTQEDDTTPVSR